MSIYIAFIIREVRVTALRSYANILRHRTDEHLQVHQDQDQDLFISGSTRTRRYIGTKTC